MMNRLKFAVFIGTLVANTGIPLSAGCFSECGCTHARGEADLVVRAQVQSQWVENTRPKRMVTHTELTVLSVIKGKAPDRLVITQAGGRQGSMEHYDSRHTVLETGVIYEFHLKARGKAWQIYQIPEKQAQVLNQETQVGQVQASANGIPSSRITPTGYNEFAGAPCRLGRNDTGQPILIKYDIDALPNGISSSQALNALQSACNAWSDASGLRFKIDGAQSFGQVAANLDGGESTIYVQLHDLYNEISDSTTLGIGGGSVTSTPSATVNGQLFNSSLGRYVVLNHRSTVMQNATTFTEVLTHELGHALGLEHSSNSANESNSILKDATMYFRVHNDARGANLRAYDLDRIAFGYPTNRPPVLNYRYMRAVARSSGQTASVLNTLPLQGYDTDGDTLTYTVSGTTSNGTYSYNSAAKTVTYTPSGQFNGSDVTGGNNGGASSNSYDRITIQASDGVNLSGAREIRIVGFFADTQTSNPLPSSWMQAEFGTTSTASIYGSAADFDGDGVPNGAEFVRGTDPTDPFSGPVGISYLLDQDFLTLSNYRHGDLIVIERSSGLGSWVKIGEDFIAGPVTAGATRRFYLTTPVSDRHFYRARVMR